MQSCVGSVIYTVLPNVDPHSIEWHKHNLAMVTDALQHVDSRLKRLTDVTKYIPHMGKLEGEKLQGMVHAVIVDLRDKHTLHALRLTRESLASMQLHEGLVPWLEVFDIAYDLLVKYALSEQPEIVDYQAFARLPFEYLDTAHGMVQQTIEAIRRAQGFTQALEREQAGWLEGEVPGRLRPHVDSLCSTEKLWANRERPYRDMLSLANAFSGVLVRDGQREVLPLHDFLNSAGFFVPQVGNFMQVQPTGLNTALDWVATGLQMQKDLKKPGDITTGGVLLQ